MFSLCPRAGLPFRAIAALVMALGVAATAATAAKESEVLQGQVVVRMIRVIDGDSLEVEARIWLGQSLRIQVRLEGIDAPELRGACNGEKALAQRAKAELSQLFEARGEEEPVLLLYDIRNDKYGGRALARVHLAKTPADEKKPRLEDGRDLGQHLLSRGLARPYEGGRRIAWCDELASPKHVPQEVYLRPRRKPKIAEPSH
jgi:endonuclease YncB( thermonuclease family)